MSLHSKLHCGENLIFPILSHAMDNLPQVTKKDKL